MLYFIHREGNEPGDESKLTYSELKRRVCQFANVLKSKGNGYLIINLEFDTICYLIVLY